MKKVYLFLLIVIAIHGRAQNTSVPTTTPLIKQLNNQKTKSKITKLIKPKDWNILFPNRYGIKQKDTLNHNPDFYSYQSFIKAASVFPTFLSEGDKSTQKRELAAFLANIAQETSGGWDDAPDGYFKYGLYFAEEQTPQGKLDYNDITKIKYPGVTGKQYYGRGPKQLSWNYNYAQFSEAWYGTKDTLLQHPEYLSRDAVVSFASAIWFWTAPQFPKPSCHDIMVNKWIPNENDLLKGRLPGFGATVNVINGGVECGTGKDLEKTSYRYQYYLYFCNYFKVTPGDNINCANQKPFGQ
jgi:basic endochitinase B